MTQAAGLKSAFAPVEDELRDVAQAIVRLAEGEGSPQIGEMLRHVLESRGKQLRSGLLLLAAKAGGQGDRAVRINLGAAIEILHLATLVHDDMIDRSELRRGRRTLNAIWGDDFALMVGDLLFGTSMDLVCTSNSVPIIARCARVVRELSHGELRESTNSGRLDLSRQEYERVVYEKTACLFACATSVGAMAGAARPEEQEALEEYGRQLGMAYQIADDIADYEQSTEQAAKPTMNDLKEGTMTLPAIIAAERGAARDELRALFEAGEEATAAQVEAAYDAVLASGAVDEARAAAAGFRDRALAALGGIGAAHVAQPLEDLARLLIPS